MEPEQGTTAEKEKKPGKGRRFIKRAAKIAVGTVVISAVATEIVFFIMFRRTKPVDRSEFPLKAWSEENDLVWSSVEFRSGLNTIRGYIVSPNAPRAVMVIAHGMNTASDGLEPIVQYYAERGFAVLLFDGTATGRSDGDSVVGLQQARYDIRAALAFLRESGRYPGLPIVLFGHSAGAYGAAVEAGDPGVAAVVCISGFDTPIGTMHRWARAYVSVLSDMQLPFLIGHEYAVLGNEANTSASEALSGSGKAALVVHGLNDDLIPLGISIYAKLESNSIECIIEDSEGHDSHGNILIGDDGDVNYPLLSEIYDFLQQTLF